MTDHERIRLLAETLYILGHAAESILDGLGGDYEAQANQVEKAMDALSREWPDLPPVKKEEQ